MTDNDLIKEVTMQLMVRFQPNPLKIKKQIEGLIEVCTFCLSLLSVDAHPYTPLK